MVAVTLGIIKWLWSPIGRVLGFAALVLIAIGTVFVRGRSAGVQSERARQQRRLDRNRRTWDVIDRERPDFDRAIDGLRNRSRTR